MTESAIISRNKAQQNSFKLQRYGREIKKIQRELELSVRFLKPLWNDEAGQQRQQEVLGIRDELMKCENQMNTLAKTFQQLSRGVVPKATRGRTGSRWQNR